jgi:hypothetical protein
LTQFRQYLIELVRAGVVLAMLLFALGSAMPEQQVGASPAVAAALAQSAGSDLCGGGKWGGEQMAHAPCHACRTGMPAVPPRPCVADPLFRAWEAIAYLAPPTPARLSKPIPRPSSRGPPALA